MYDTGALSNDFISSDWLKWYSRYLQPGNYISRTVSWNEGGSRKRKVSGQREDLGVLLIERAKTTAPASSHMVARYST